VKVINPESLGRPSGYNHGILVPAGKLLFVAGQIGWDRNLRMAEGLVAQFDLALSNILEVVRDAGGSGEHIVRFTIFIKDKSDYLAQTKEIGRVYRKHLGKHFPAMSLLEVKDLLEEDALIEIETTAVIP
jgi:enamine deaminase RidA (YjgF/YER057c/UK114 family)